MGGWECMLGGESLEDGSTVSESTYVHYIRCVHFTCGNIRTNAFVYIHIYTCMYIEVRTYEHSIQYVRMYVHLTCGNILVHLYTYMYTYDQVSSTYVCIYVSCMCHVLACV